MDDYAVSETRLETKKNCGSGWEGDRAAGFEGGDHNLDLFALLQVFSRLTWNGRGEKKLSIFRPLPAQEGPFVRATHK